MSYMVSWANAVLTTSVPARLVNHDHLSSFLSIVVPSLEVEVKARHQAAAGKGRAIRREPLLTYPRVFVVPSETCPARHDGHPTEAEYVVVDVAQVRWIGCIRLL